MSWCVCALARGEYPVSVLVLVSDILWGLAHPRSLCLAQFELYMLLPYLRYITAYRKRF